MLVRRAGSRAASAGLAQGRGGGEGGRPAAAYSSAPSFSLPRSSPSPRSPPSLISIHQTFSPSSSVSSSSSSSLPLCPLSSSIPSSRISLIPSKSSNFKSHHNLDARRQYSGFAASAPVAAARLKRKIQSRHAASIPEFMAEEHEIETVEHGEDLLLKEKILPNDPYARMMHEMEEVRETQGQLNNQDLLRTLNKYNNRKREVVGSNLNLDTMPADQRNFVTLFPELMPWEDKDMVDAGVKVMTKGKQRTKRIVLDFAPDIKVAVNGFLEINAEDVKTYLPEGPGGVLKGQAWAWTSDRGILFRRDSFNLIKELTRRKENAFLRSAGNESLVLTGSSGSGKSAILTTIVYWARRNDWLVVWIPDGKKFGGGRKLEDSKIMPGFYDQPDIGATLCKRLLLAHEDKLRELPIKNEFDIAEFQRSSRSSLADLLDFGAKNPMSSCEAAYHFRRELNRVTEYPVLIAADRYNLMYHQCEFLNPDDAIVERGNMRPLQAQRLTLTNLFSNHQDTGLVNGTMVHALQTTRSAEPFYKQCGFDNLVDVQNYSYEEFESIMNRYRAAQWVTKEEVTRATEKYIYQLHQGNPMRVFKYAGLLN